MKFHKLYLVIGPNNLRVFSSDDLKSEIYSYEVIDNFLVINIINSDTNEICSKYYFKNFDKFEVYF